MILTTIPLNTALIANWLLAPILGVMILLFILRIVLTWYPQADLQRLPFNLIAWTTEPFLIPMRKLIPPFGGVDITPIVWVGIFSLMRELLLGQQGLLTMVTRLQ
jgi:YggT family protein